MNKKKYINNYIEETIKSYKKIKFDESNIFDIIHIYNTKEIAYPHGYHDAMWVKVDCFNTNDKTMFQLDREQDAVFLGGSKISNIRFFIDNSICIKFIGMHKFNGIFQASTIISIN